MAKMQQRNDVFLGPLPGGGDEKSSQRSVLSPLWGLGGLYSNSSPIGHAWATTFRPLRGQTPKTRVCTSHPLNPDPRNAC